MSLTALFDIIHESHYTIQLIFQLFFFTLLAKSFQFQLNKLFQIDKKYIYLAEIINSALVQYAYMFKSVQMTNLTITSHECMHGNNNNNSIN